MNAQIPKIGPLPDPAPRLLQVDEVRPILDAGESPGRSRFTKGLQDLYGATVQVHDLGAGLAVRQTQATTPEVDMLPAQGENFR